MHYLLIVLSIILVILGWWGMYDASTHGTGTGQISYAGTFLGLSNMIVGLALGILARIAQAGHHQRQLLQIPPDVSPEGGSREERVRMAR